MGRTSLRVAVGIPFDLTRQSPVGGKVHAAHHDVVPNLSLGFGLRLR